MGDIVGILGAIVSFDRVWIVVVGIKIILVFILLLVLQLDVLSDSILANQTSNCHWKFLLVRLISISIKI